MDEGPAILETQLADFVTETGIGEEIILGRSIPLDLLSTEDHRTTSGLRRPQKIKLLYASAERQVKGELVERGLGAPVQACEIGVFTVMSAQDVGFGGFALHTSDFFVLCLHPPCLLAIAFRHRRFSWSCDGTLLSAVVAQA